MIVPDSGGGLHYDSRGENARPADAEAGLGEAVALREKSGRLRRRGHRVSVLLGQPGLAADKETILAVRDHVEFEKLAALGIVENFLDLVIVIAAGDGRVDEIGQR